MYRSRFFFLSILVALLTLVFLLNQDNFINREHLRPGPFPRSELYLRPKLKKNPQQTAWLKQDKNEILQHQRRVDTSKAQLEVSTADSLKKDVKYEDIVKESMDFIENEMKNYRFSNNESLNDLVPVTSGQPKLNLILTTWRSGSTFLGEVLNSVPGTLYHYEPFSHYKIVQIRDSPLAEKSLLHLKKLLTCDYSEMDDFLRFSRANKWVFEHNVRLWTVCKKNPQACYDPEFLSQFCNVFPFHLVKTVRLRLKYAEELLETPTVRVLYLVRDPRGTLQSRKHRVWCPGVPDCDQPSILCADLVSDYSAAIRLQTLFPDRFRVIRYEDLSLNPLEQVQELLSFFQLDFDKNVLKFLENHTKFDMGGVSSTFRNSKSAPFHWRSDLSYEEVESIEEQCLSAMQLWGYVRAPNKTDLKLFNPLTDYKIER